LFGVARTPHLDCRRDQIFERHLFSMFLFHTPKNNREGIPVAMGCSPQVGVAIPQSFDEVELTASMQRRRPADSTWHSPLA
jgi:hypothetical protein